MSNARVAGVGMTKFVKPGQQEPYRVMASKAINIALEDAGIDYSKIEQAYGSYVYGDSCCAQHAAYDAGMKTVDDIKGHSVAMTQVGSTFHYMTNLIANAKGWSMDDMKMVPLQKVGSMVAAVKSGQVDVLIMVPHIAKALAGAGAAQFAAEQGLATMPPEWFETERRQKALERMKAERLSALDVDIKFGTVGAVARDSKGNLAAGTSTGGMTGKRWGRVGDAPVIGAGTYADNRACAVSATGWGEFFIRVGVAQEICTRIRLVRQQAAFASGGAQHAEWLAGQDYVQRITDAVLAEVEELGGDGGVIVVTPLEDPVFGMNTSGMYRGRATSGGVNEVAIYADE